MRVVCWLAVVLVSSVAAAGPSSPELGPGTIVDRVLVEVDIAPLEEVRILAITPAQLPPVERVCSSTVSEFSPMPR